MTSQRDDIASAFVVIAFSALLVWAVIPAQTIPGDEGELAQAFMPTAAALIMMAAAAVLLVRTVVGITIRKRSDPTGTPLDAEGDPATGGPSGIDRIFWVVLVTAVALLAVSLIVISRFGLVLGGGAMIFAFGLLFSLRSWLSIAILSIVFPIVAYVLVRFGLGIAIL